MALLGLQKPVGMTEHQTPILLVEDNDDDIHIVERALKHAQAKSPPMVVRDGRAAVAHLSRSLTCDPKGLPQLLLLDIQMPGMDGFEVLRWVRSKSPLAGLAVVMFSASAQSQDVARAYELGANSYLQKPGTLDETVQLLASVHNYWCCGNQKADFP